MPGACGGKADVVFVGSSGGSDGSGGAEGGQGGMGGMGGAGTGGANTGGTTGGTGGGNTGGSGGTISATCGNSETESGEACDSGGQDASNCDFDCTDAECGDGYTNEEARETCDDDGESAECDDDCTVPECGDGVLNRSAGEQCDDDNSDDGDGCTAECVRELLVIGDGVSDGDALEVLRSAGFPVVQAPVIETMFDGTNPMLDNFCGVIQFDSDYDTPMPLAGQEALVDYVDGGGAFMSTGWSTAEEELIGGVDTLSELFLLDYETDITSGTYELTPEAAAHPVTAGLPASFLNNSLGEAGQCKTGSVPLIADGAWHGLCVSDGTDGRRLISLGSSFGYIGYRPLQHFEMATLLINSANWLCDTDYSLLTMSAGSTETVERFGYRVQCQAWEGDLCIAPYMTLNVADVSAPVPHCIDDATSLRPIWFGTATDQAMTWCWIATGRSTYSIASEDGTNSVYSGLWMYTAGTGLEICDDGYGRHYSNVNVPTIGAQVWSFDDTDYIRQGTFMNVACDW